MTASRESAQDAHHGPEAIFRACPYCQDHPAHSGASWWLVIPLEISGLNERAVNEGPARHVYKAKRRQWAWAIESEVRMLGGTFHRLRVTERTEAPRRRVEVIRVYGGSGREQSKLLDHDNLVGGAKPIMDMLVKSEALVDDDPKHLIAHYRQVDIHEGRATLLTAATSNPLTNRYTLGGLGRVEIDGSWTKPARRVELTLIRITDWIPRKESR